MHLIPGNQNQTVHARSLIYSMEGMTDQKQPSLVEW